MTTAQTTLSLVLDRISLSFEGVPILKEVDFTAAGGEIHAVLGANGAGKSSLMKVLSGAYTADSGTVEINHKAVKLTSPKEAKSNGIQCIYQEVDSALFPELSVAENILVEQRGGAWMNWGRIHLEAKRLLDVLGVKTSTKKHIHELTLAEKQMILIARAIASDAKIIIFDEPTAPLSIAEADKLFDVMRQLKTKGLLCIFISHRLQEVFEHCDCVTVMRDGKRISTRRTDQTSYSEVIEDMIGSTFQEEFPEKKVTITGDVLFEVNNLRKGLKTNGVSFSIHKGEIVGIVGLVGAGKTELSRLLFGIDPWDQGTIKRSGKLLSLKNPKQAMKERIALVPEERRKEGILIDETVGENLSLPTLHKWLRFGVVDRKAQKRVAETYIDALGIKTSGPHQVARYLSGGNQQKIAIGKWLPADADVYILDEPTKGVDVGAKKDIFHLLTSLAEQGKGILYLSSEIGEILGISDRILVMYDGRIVKEFARGEASQDDILLYASGGKEEQR